MGLVRKGAMARDRMKRDPAVARACDDLARLADFGALEGIANIIAERRRQVEQMNWTPDHDALLPENQLLVMAAHRIGLVTDYREAGETELPEGTSYELALREAGAMIAADIDRARSLRAAHAETAVGDADGG